MVGPDQGCQMGYFQKKNINLGKFWRALEWKMLVDFMVICNILQPLGMFHGNLVMLWSFGMYIFHRFGILCHEKSGIPGPDLALTRNWIPQNFRNPEFTKTDAIWICPNKFMYLKLKLKSKFF
jgi:hypothetical protein